MKILVLGGNGFIGSSIVAKLQAQGAQVLVASRKSVYLTIKMQQMLHVEDWLPLINSVDVVVNSVGILRERKNESYQAVHNIAVASLATACAKLELKLIHLSAIGLSASAKSEFIRSKFAGEQAIIESGAQAYIVRASLLDGEGGYGAKWFRRVATWPLQLVMQSDGQNKGQVAPLQVSDLGEAVANLCMQQTDYLQGKRPKIIELGGNEVLTIAQYLAKLRAVKQLKPALQLAMPKLMVRVASHIFDVFALTPLSFGHFELMQGYNVPAVNMLPILLGRKPAELGETIETRQIAIDDLMAIKY